MILIRRIKLCPLSNFKSKNHGIANIGKRSHLTIKCTDAIIEVRHIIELDAQEITPNVKGCT